MQTLQDRQKKIEEDLSAAPPTAPRLHPNLAAIYKEKIANLVQALNDSNTLIEAHTAIRKLIERVQLVPENGELKIELYGELGALLKLGTELKNEHPHAESEGVQITMVAGAGFETRSTPKQNHSPLPLPIHRLSKGLAASFANIRPHPSS